MGGFPIPPAAGRVSRNREFQSGRGFQSRIWKPFRDLELRLKKKGLVVLHKAVPARHPRKRLHAEPRAVVTPELGCPVGSVDVGTLLQSSLRPSVLFLRL